MRNTLNKSLTKDPRITYRGAVSSRLDNLTDAVFGVAITLLIFNLANPESFDDLIMFTKTIPAFTLSIVFLVLIWNEHRRFSEVYGNDDSVLTILNTLFIGLVISLVFPLRFLTLLLTQLYFAMDIPMTIQEAQIPYLMIYYGLVIVSLYLVIFLFYARAINMRTRLMLNEYELFLAKETRIRLAILFSVPAISILTVLFIQSHSPVLASFLGGMVYWLCLPCMLLWDRNFRKKASLYT